MSLKKIEDEIPLAEVEAEVESFGESPPMHLTPASLKPFRTQPNNITNVEIPTQPRPTTLIPSEKNHQDVSTVALPAPNSLSLPDYYIPQQEKKHLLRKFSAPLLNRQQTLSLLARSPSFDELATVRRSSDRPLTLLRPDSRSSANIRKFIDDKLKCPLCKNAFSDPRVLDCLHSFCFQCLCNESDGKHGRQHRENSDYELSCEF